MIRFFHSFGESSRHQPKDGLTLLTGTEVEEGQWLEHKEKGEIALLTPI